MVENKSKLDELSDKIDLIISQKNDDLKKVSVDKNRVGAGLALATQFISALVIGISIGIFLDKIFGTSYIFLMIFLFFGVFAGFLNCYRFEKKYNSDNKIIKKDFEDKSG